MVKHGIILIWLWSLVVHAEPPTYRIVSLAPHTTEWVYELGAQEFLVGVSEYSDYPIQAKQLPVIANHQGVNFEKVIALKPDLVLAWRGGNQPQDIDRLKTLGFQVFESTPSTLDDIPTEITALASIIGKQQAAKEQAQAFSARLASIKQRNHTENRKRVFYYLWSTPLMSVGRDAWATHLLHECGAQNIFSNSAISYPEVSVESVIARQPAIIISATGHPNENDAKFWAPWLTSLKLERSAIRSINPDLAHRFTSRALDGLVQLCAAINHK